MMQASMDKRRRVLLSWSSGKDSAWTLHRLRQMPEVEVVGLLTTVNGHFGRSAIHGVRQKLVRRQAAATGLDLFEVPLPWPCSNADYETLMGEALEACRARFAMDTVAFGDLFLEDVRRYREERMAGTGLGLLFPLWGTPTARLAREMIDGGLRARITCLDPRRVPASLAGGEFDARLLEALPREVDPCGENGEFHTFVWDGPMFRRPVTVAGGEVVNRDGFVYADLIAEDGG